MHDVSPLRPGTLVDARFTIEASAGGGGMGRVYRARDGATGALTALKVCTVGAADAEARFAEEARILAGLSHPGIVRYLAQGSLPGGAAYLVMEWVEGEDLGARLARGPLSLRDGARLLHAAAGALGAAHRAGIVHRDVKPQNLSLAGGDPGRVKVLDFGIARALTRERGLTRTGSTLGTPAYMAPEQVRGERALDARVDVFALGAVFLECVSGRPAFPGDHAMAVLAKVLLTEAPRLGEVVAGAPRELEDLVAAMLTKDPAMRPRDAGEVAAAVAPLLRGTALDEAAPANRESIDLHASLPTAPATDVAAGLTASERRIACVVLVGAGDAADTIPIGALSDVGARWDELPDGSVVFVFDEAGQPMDRAAQAARCALRLRDALPPVPVAVAMGWVGEGDGGLRGDVLDRAVQLLTSGAPGDGARPVRIDDGVASLLGLRFDVREDGGRRALHGEREVVSPRRTLLGRPTPFVGRGGELRQLEGLFETCVEDGAPRAAVVIAPAGAGKSRLRAELCTRLSARGAEVWVGAGDPLRAGSAFASLAEALRGAAGIASGDPRDVRRDRLLARVARASPAAAVGRIAPFLGEIAGVPFDDAESVQLAAARRDPVLMSDQTRRAFEDFVAAEAEARPIALMLEDFHWGDAPTVAAVDGVLRNLQNRPFLVVAWARPEARSSFPSLWEAHGALALHLGPLPRRAALELGRAILPAGIAAEVLEDLVDRAEGNAFYLEELLRAAAEGRAGELPTAVMAMVEARLAAIDADARRVLRAASVFGQRFRRGEVRALLASDLDDTALDAAMDRIVRRELVVRQVDAVTMGETPKTASLPPPASRDPAYAFRHALVREAAYATLTDADRQRGHALAAAFLSRAGDADAQVLAEHHLRGGEPARAAWFYRRAAEQALEAGDFAGTCERVERAVACGAEGPLYGELRALEAEALRWRGDWASAERAARAAIEHLPRGVPLHSKALATAAVASGAQGALDRLDADAILFGHAPDPGDDAALAAWITSAARIAIALVLAGRQAAGEALMDRFDALAPIDPRSVALAHQARGTRLVARGDRSVWIDEFRASAERFEEAGDFRSACAQRGNAGYGLIVVGAHAEAERELRANIAAAQRMNLTVAVAHAQHNLGLALGYLGALEEARALEADAVVAYQKQGAPRMLGLSRAYLAWLHALAGDLDRAEEEARAAVEVLAGFPPALACGLGILARILVQRGSPDAVEVARRGIGILEQLRGIDDGEATLRLAWAEALAAAGRADEARAAVLDARAYVLGVAAGIGDTGRREGFLRSVPENRRILELAGEMDSGAR